MNTMWDAAKARDIRERVARLTPERTRQWGWMLRSWADDLSTRQPAFGRLTRPAWGVLSYRHIDHHLRQFGV